ncbi:MAG TPA: hypothetical protein VNH11_10585 [Pirellulales bacterium]|nr:hypothetical protein [Pirellulales bacterium]
MDSWDLALWAIAGYVAVFTLVRLMNARRTKVLGELRERAAAQASRAPATEEGEAKK